MFQRLLFHILAGIGGLWVATEFIPNVEFTGSWQLLLLIGAILGIMNGIAKPILNLLTFPIRVLTLGLSSFLISILLVLAMDLVFSELDIIGFIALLGTTIAVWGLRMLLSLLSRGRI